MKYPAITSGIAALVLGAVALVALAQEQATLRAPYWPALKGTFFLSEWYSDVPWHQKLGTYAANEIVVPLIFPYEVLPKAETDFCKNQKPPLHEEDCMIETGVANILGYHRFDTRYDETDKRIADAGECKAPNQCIEVRLEVSNFLARSTGSTIALQPEVIGSFVKQPVYGGFYITDGSTYGPQMLWEMSHYCDSKFAIGDMQDPVCYGDYFSPMNDGFHLLATTSVTDWPRSSPWSVFPTGAPPEPTNQCPPGETKCVIVLGGFAMGRVLAPFEPLNMQYGKYNDLLLQWFNNALIAFPSELGQAEIQNHFPWNGNPVTWDSFIYPRAVRNPFLGSYAPTPTQTAPAVQVGCDTGLDGGYKDGKLAGPGICTDAPHYQAAGYVYPRNCTLDDLASAAAGSMTSADKLRQCGLNYEIHPNGWVAQWPTDYQAIVSVAPFNYTSNQYGRTSFIFGGVPGMQMPVSFYKDPASDSGMSIYEQVHNASIFSLFLPAANIADVKRAMTGRNYGDTGFYHTLLMSNHMESDPEQFADGIRGKVLWHNEYRMEPMYEARNTTWLRDRTFQAAFDPLKSKYDPAKAPAPFHNNTCDGCHVRNGSGVPINTAYKLDPVLQEFMSNNQYVPYGSNGKEYTFTGEIRPMKLVFFDLQPNLARLSDASSYSQPLVASADALANAPRTVGPDALYYNNKIMNYYGDSFHVTPRETTVVFDFAWNYEAIKAEAADGRVVVDVPRVNAELKKTYQPMQIALGKFLTDSKCQLVSPSPTNKPWPKNCSDIDDAAIHAAIDGGAVGYMLLNGKRLGNLSVIESIPGQAIIDFRTDQETKLGQAIAGELIWSPGSRDGVGGKNSKFRECKIKSKTHCYIGRFGWLGDRASLEDQVANAAFVEMNMLTSAGYRDLYDNNKENVANPIRYKYPNCGAANKTCVESTQGNSELSERDIDRMADYARWLGNPTRSEIQVSQKEVMAGETIFKQLQCDTCHVIKRIKIVPDQTMLTKNFRDRLVTHVSKNNNPFLSYIGTDLLMHDMGYLSQVGISAKSIRDATSGVVLPGFELYVQKVRTPPLKGLRFNNYVTDAHKNTTKPGDPGCDFLLHDGRACDAIEAAFLHDGPAIKQLQVIQGLNALSASEVLQLRAFLYSL